MKNLTAVLHLVTCSGAQIFGYGNQGGFAFTSVLAPALYDKVQMIVYRRNGNATPETMRADSGTPPPFHHLVDPTTVASKFSLIWENLIQAATALGACRVIAGFYSYMTAGVANTLMGVGFYADAADNLYHCYVADCPTGVGAVTVRRDTATAVLCTSIHRLKIIFDGPTKKISWYIDNTLVDSWVPAAPLDRMAPAANLMGPSIVAGAVVPANGDVTVRTHGGQGMTIRMVFAATPTIAATGGGSRGFSGIIG